MEKYLFEMLKRLGLSNDEARVYEAVLDLGQSVVTPIASQAKVNRTTCYNILESLINKKMLIKTSYRGKIAYGVGDPSQIIANLEEQKKNLDTVIAEAKTFQPELVKRYTQKNTKPIIRYVEGTEGLIELYEDSLRCENKKEGLRAYSSLRDITLELGDYAKHYYKERTRREIPIRGIVPDTEFGKHIKKVQTNFLRDARLVPKEKFDFSPEIYLYDNKLAIMSFKEKFGFLLESREIVDALKVAWELAWERAEEYDAEIESI